MTRIRVTCDGCGSEMFVPRELAEEVNYCRNCLPVTEEYDPESEDGDWTEEACD